MNHPSLLNALCKPRSAVTSLVHSVRSQVAIFAIVLLTYFSQICLLSLYLQQEKLNQLLTFKGFLAAIIILTLMSIGFFTLVYAASLAFWTAAQGVKGQASLPQTRAAVLWTALWTMPLGFLFLLVASTIPREELFWVRILLYATIIATLCYGWIVLLKTLSEVNRFGIGRALFTAIGGCVLLYGFVQVTLAFYRVMHWI